jgi:hypothetical protein
MTDISRQALEKEEMELLREQMLEPEELFLIQFLKNSNRRAAKKLQEVYSWDISFFPDE